jgi:hypothetical protein
MPPPHLVVKLLQRQSRIAFVLFVDLLLEVPKLVSPLIYSSKRILEGEKNNITFDLWGLGRFPGLEFLARPAVFTPANSSTSGEGRFPNNDVILSCSALVAS